MATYTVNITVSPPNWSSLHKDQIARAVAYILRSEESKVISVTANREGLILEVGVEDVADLKDIEARTVALLELAAAVCPCGCGADLTLGNCYKDDPHYETDGLTSEEAQFVATGNPITAIKALRERMGLSLKEAKERVDLYRMKHHPTSGYYRQAVQNPYYGPSRAPRKCPICLHPAPCLVHGYA